MEPAPDILHVYGRAIVENGGQDVVACGFIGKTAFPPPVTSLQRAILLSDLTFMYGISDHVARPAWGVTANIVVRVASARTERRWDTMFGESFPKTGGGEDVDFCIR